MNNKTKDVLVVGFALFAMFFGAGNLIFPPYLGHAVGDNYLLAILGFVITGVGLPILAIIVCSKGDGTFETMASRIGTKFSVIFASILFIAIGPMLGIPRTAATTYEIAINPMIPSMSPIISMVIYFAINLIFVLKRSTVIDAIGKFLTPVLITILGIVIVKGIVFPIGEIVNTNSVSVFSTSVIEGYQTMDALAALLFATVATNSIKAKGYSNDKVVPMVLKSGILAAIGLAFVYGGLTYLGAQTTTLVDSSISKTALLLFISEGILGDFGKIIIAIGMSVACLTTSIGLITAGSSFFEKVTKGKLSYKFNAIVISLISVVIGAMGVDRIIGISGPILNILYPVSITLIITTLLSRYVRNIKAVKLGVYTSLVMGILGEVKIINLTFIPLSSMGFAWVIPTLLMIGVGYCLFKS